MQGATMNRTRQMGKQITITKYEALEAFFRTEDEDNDKMAVQLNEIIKQFYDKELLCKRNITELSFDSNEYKKAIEYINK